MEVIREICQEVAVMEEGYIAEYGSIADVFAAPKTNAARELLNA
jgi:D-methionine transport system ATP-binding protein